MNLEDLPGFGCRRFFRQPATTEVGFRQLNLHWMAAVCEEESSNEISPKEGLSKAGGCHPFPNMRSAPGTFSTNYLNFYLAQLRRPVDDGPNSLDVAAVVSPAATANDVRLDFADFSA